jgi:hypothetical protein
VPPSDGGVTGFGEPVSHGTGNITGDLSGDRAAESFADVGDQRCQAAGGRHQVGVLERANASGAAVRERPIIRVGLEIGGPP